MSHRDDVPDTLPADALIIVPVRNTVLFPGTVFPIAVQRERSILAAQQALREERSVGILMQRDAEIAEPSALDLHRTGTIANILRYVNTPDGSHHLVLQGEQRISVVDFIREQPFFVAHVKRIEQPDIHTPEIEARILQLRRQALEGLQLLPQVPQEMIAALQSAASPGALADLIAAYLDIKPDKKQELLETIDVTVRMDKVANYLAQRIEVLRLTQEIGRQTKASLDERASERRSCASRWRRSSASSARPKAEGRRSPN
jgi:ATP-dependent Lon protease